MAPATRGQTPQQALVHLLGVLDNENITKCFKAAGIESIVDFVGLTQDDFVQLSYTRAATQEDVEDVVLSVLEHCKLCQVQSWYQQQTEHTVATWFLFTKESFDSWILVSSKSPATIEAPTLSSTPTVPDPVLQFQKSIKRSVSDFTKFHDDKFWHT